MIDRINVCSSSAPRLGLCRVDKSVGPLLMEDAQILDWQGKIDGWKSWLLGSKCGAFLLCSGGGPYLLQ